VFWDIHSDLPREGPGEAVWLRPDPPETVRRFWSEAYPAMATVESCRAVVRISGYRLLGDFVLPNAAWWEYFGPLRQRLARLAAKYAGDAAAERVLRLSADEIVCFEIYAAFYGYVFLVMAVDEPGV
jgi:hypothetical protein